MSEEAEKAEKKIIVDEDWKSQVAAEKEAARQQAQRLRRRPAPRRPRRPRKPRGPCRRPV